LTKQRIVADTLLLSISHNRLKIELWLTLTLYNGDKDNPEYKAKDKRLRFEQF
jgi:hypothetical protein